MGAALSAPMAMSSAGASCCASIASYVACSTCSCLGSSVTKSSARAAYTIMFMMSILLAFIMRDYAKPLMEKIPWIRVSGNMPSDDFFGMQAVYRVSLGNFLFYAVLACLTSGIKSRADNRDKFIHHGSWGLKAFAWVLCNALPFFFPLGVVNAYTWLARLGSGLFLIVQLLILIDFAHTVNDSWVEKAEERQAWLGCLLGVTVVALLGILAGAGALYYVFYVSPQAHECRLNGLFIGSATVLALLGCVAPLHPAVGGSVFPSTVVGVYIMYLCYSALSSEPLDYPCNGLSGSFSSAHGSDLLIGVALTLVSVVYSALRVGSNDRFFRIGGDAPAAADGADSEEAARGRQRLLDGDEAVSSPADAEMTRGAEDAEAGEEVAAPKDEPPSYNYSWFHAIFALASLYVAMLLTGWGKLSDDQHAQGGDVDVGWFSVWVKMASCWLTAALQIWTTVAPAVFPDRDFS